MPSITRRRSLALTVLATLLMGSILFLAGQSPADAQVVPKPREPGRQYAAWLPPGEYTAIVINSNADERDWAISLRTKRGGFPIVVPAHTNVVVPFERAWKVEAGDEARLVSEYVPFADITRLNQLANESRVILSAWGIGASGPVAFVYREVK